MMNMHLFLVVFLKFINLALCENEREYYYKQGSCEGDEETMGSIGEPFSFLRDVFEKLVSQQYLTPIRLIFLDEITDIESEMEEMRRRNISDITYKFEFLDFTITNGKLTDLPPSRIISRNGSLPFSLNILSGKFQMLNFEFFSGVNSSELEYNGEKIYNEVMAPGFITLGNYSNTSIVVMNCVFDGIYTKDDKFSVLSLFFLDFSNATERIYSQIFIKNVIFKNMHYPQGVLYSNGQIELINILFCMELV